MVVEIMNDRGKARVYSGVSEIVTEHEKLHITKNNGKTFSVIGSIFKVVSEN